MVKLKRLKINKYRNVRPGTELRFDDGFNLVLGKNGSGKTTLLGLIAMACGWNLAELEGEELALEFDIDADGCRIEFILLNERTTDASLAYSFTLLLPQDAATLVFHGTSASLAISVMEDKSSSRSHPPCSPFEYDFLHQLAHMLTDWARESQAQRMGLIMTLHSLRFDVAPSRFDEALGAFYALTGQNSPPSRPAGPDSLATTASVIAAPKTSVSINSKHSPYRFSGPFIRELVAKNPDLSPSSALSSDNLGVLTELAELLEFAKIELRPDISAMSGTVLARKITIQAVKFFFYGKNGNSISHDLLSYGQKRVVSFFFYLYFTTPGVVIADELVNGLHHRWIEACMEAIGDRQAFLTSQNPLLFDYIPDFTSAEQVQSRFITCKTEVVDGAEQLVWQNLSQADAEMFFDAYRAEIEPVGEILITRGLW